MKNFYRAKSIGKNEWVYGALLERDNRAFIIPIDSKIIKNKEKITTDGIPVVNNTICHFLKKANGIDFFEFDIIYDRVLKMRGTIKYDERTARFICETSGKAVFIPFDLTLEGNLFDNLDDLNKKST